MRREETVTLISTLMENKRVGIQASLATGKPIEDTKN